MTTHVDQPCPRCRRPGIRIGPGWNIDTRQMEIEYHCVDCGHTWHVVSETQPMPEKN